MKKIEQLQQSLFCFQKILSENWDTYDTIREYVDMIQEENFDNLFRFVKNRHLKNTIKDGFLLERWTVLVIFYLQLEKKHKILKQVIFNIITLICDNLVIYLLYIERHSKGKLERRSIQFMTLLQKKEIKERVQHL